METILFGEYAISCEPARIDLDAVEELLCQTYWAKNRPREVIEKSLQNSIVFGAFLDGKQVALARVVTDYATFGWVCDVVVDPDHRGRGLSKALMDALLGHPELTAMRRLILATKDATSLYSRYGFKELAGDLAWMELRQDL
ncbi:MAG: GNAT family N-acetyltransferase [Armatimonadetes bacterium]|nr:GNAT family N-acetyltransferase [Armatimonadota bacterium]